MRPGHCARARALRIAVLSLGLGIGANTAIFSLIDAVLMKMLPVRNPQELVLLSYPSASGVSSGNSTGVRGLFSVAEFQHLRERQQVFSNMLAWQSNPERTDASIDGGAPESVRECLVTGSYFPVLGVQAIVGRTFTEAEDPKPHGAPFAVISYAYWEKRFAKRADVLGKVIRIGKAPLTVIGVAPPGFFGAQVGEAPDVWAPMAMQPDVMPGQDWLHDDESKVLRIMWLHVMGRLKPGVTTRQAQANISVVFQQLLSSYQVPGLDAENRRAMLDQKIELSGGDKGPSSLRKQLSQPLLVLMTVVGLVLLIACANIANLLLARAAARQKEISVRLAMGANRLRLGTQLMTESLVLAFLGGGLGVAMAGWASQALLQVASETPQAIPLDVHVDLRVLAFTAALSILTGILFGLAPAFRAARFDVASTLKENSRGVLGGGKMSLGKILVVAQIAISLLLLIGAGLFLRTLQNLKEVQLGYERGKLIVMRVDSLSAGYKNAAAMDLYMRLLDAIRTIPGVRSATFSQNGLFSGSESGTELYVEGYTPAKRGDNGAAFDHVGPDYFLSLGIPLLRGREIGRQDTGASTPVCVINETMAREFFANRDPLGKHIKDLFPGSNSQYEIVGVARDVRDHSLRDKVQRRFYVPVSHAINNETPSFVNYEVRSAGEPGSVIAALRKKVRELDPSLPIRNLDTLDDLVDRRVVQERMIAELSAFFGALALLLASIGLYGVLSYAVARRTNEIGIRMAIGAEQSTVIRMILQETLVLVVTGSVIGLGAAMGLGELVASRMYGVRTADPATLVAATATLTIVAMAAACFPALRAARVDPVVALRVE